MENIDWFVVVLGVVCVVVLARIVYVTLWLTNSKTYNKWFDRQVQKKVKKVEKDHVKLAKKDTKR